MEQPIRYDLSRKSDMEFRRVMERFGGVHRMAASTDFRLVASMARLQEELRAIKTSRSKRGAWLVLERGVMLEKIEAAIVVGLPYFDAFVKDDGDMVNLQGTPPIDMVRHIYPGKSAEHRSLKIEYEGEDLGKQLFCNQLYIYDNLAIDEVKVTATEVGRYAWAKYGFNSLEDDIEDSHQSMMERCGITTEGERERHARVSWGRYVPAEPPDHIAKLAVIYIPKWELDAFVGDVAGDMKEEPWDDDTYIAEDGSFLLGKYILMIGSMWSGTLSLKEGSIDRGILEGYIKCHERISPAV